MLHYNDGTREPLGSAYLRLESHGGATKNFAVRERWYQLVASETEPGAVLQLSHDGERIRRVVRVEAS